jgi:hypothetical protein
MHMRNRMLWMAGAATLATVMSLSMTVLLAQAPSGTKKALP